MRSIIMEFKTLPDMQETFKRMNIMNVTAAPDNELLVQLEVDEAQYRELLKLDCVTLVDEI